MAIFATLSFIAHAAGGPAVLHDHEYLIANWESADGLPENSATAIVQKPDGYLWFGSFGGVVRFNGVEFTGVNPANTPALPSAGIVNLHLDQSGRLWISTYQGLVVARGPFWRDVRKVDGWPGGFARTFVDGKDGQILITTFDGRLFVASEDRFAELPAPPGEKGHGYFGGVDEDGHWWAVQNQFIGRWDGQRWVAMMPAPKGARDGVGCAPARGGGLWLLTGTELRKWRAGGVALHVTLPERPGGVWSLFEDSRGQVWIASHNRGFCRVSTNGVMQRWNAARGVSDAGRCVFEDREGNLWLGTSGDGLVRFTPRRFQHFDLKGNRKALVVQSVCADPGGGVWAATYGRGLFHLNEIAGRPASESDLDVDPPYLQSVLADRAGRLWIGTLGKGLWRAESNSLRQVPEDKTGGGNVLALFEDSRGRIWASGGGSSAVGRFDGQDFQTMPVVGAAAGISAFAEDASGAIWLLAGGRVFRTTNDSSFLELTNTDQSPLRGINCILADADGGMWLGGAERGLLRWKNGRLTRVGAELDPPLADVRGMVADDAGYLWLTSTREIFRVRRADLDAAAEGRAALIDCRRFNESDGLPRAEFVAGRQPNCAKDSQGRLWFATTKGVAMIDPATVKLNEQPPPVHIEEISYLPSDDELRQARPGFAASRQRRIIGDDAFTEPIIIPPGSRRLEIHFAGLSLAAPEKMRFQTKLEGRDANWHGIDDSHVAQFDNLPPRDYLFRVRAANNDGVWNESGASLAFRVMPQFWQTWWFRGGAGILLVGLGGFGVWWRSRNRLRSAMEKERAAHEIRQLAGRLINAQEDERRRIARELHDDFSQRLALLSVEMELMGRATPAVDADATARLAEMATRVKELSSEVHRMAYELHPAKLDQLGLAAAARSLCRELSQQSGVRIEFDPGSVPREIPPEVALCLYRILQEALQNVVRHSGVTEARAALREEPGRVSLTVSDPGRGFDAEKARRDGGMGLSSMQERVRLLSGVLEISSTPGQGTRVEAWVPLDRGITKPAKL